MDDLIFSSDVTENVWSIKKGRHVHSFPGIIENGFISAERVNDKIFAATKKRVLYLSIIFTFSITYALYQQ